MNNIYKGIVLLESDEQFQELVTSGSVTLESGEVINYSPNDTTYYTPQTAVVVDESLSLTSTNPVQNKAVKDALDGKINRLAQDENNRVYVRTTNGEDSSLPFTYTAEADSIAKRSASGTLAVETPTQENDATNKSYVDTKLSKKLDKDTAAGSFRVYAVTNQGVNYMVSFGNGATNNTLALRDSNGYLRAVTPPTTETTASVTVDYANKNLAQKYLSLTGESGTLDDDQYALVTGYDNLIIQRTGVDLRRCGYPSNGQGNYVFISPYYASANGTKEFDAYIITIKQDKTWTFALENFIQISEQTYAPIVIIEPASATNGTLSDDDFDNLTEHDDVRIKLNGEYYIKMDDEHIDGLVSYIHEGWNGSGTQTKSINITLSTKAWTLVVGDDHYYKHYIQMTVGDKTIYYDFTSTKSSAYTSATLPAMPDNIITPIQVVAGGYYSSVSGLIYRNGENALKAILHGMYTTNGTSVSYLSVTGGDATFVSDTVSKL